MNKNLFFLIWKKDHKKVSHTKEERANLGALLWGRNDQKWSVSKELKQGLFVPFDKTLEIGAMGVKNKPGQKKPDQDEPFTSCLAAVSEKQNPRKKQSRT